MDVWAVASWEAMNRRNAIFLLKKTAFYLRQKALYHGLMGGQSHYRPFIILGEARSGSNFLRGLLNSHPQVMVFGEIFRFYDNIGWEVPEYEAHQQTPRLISLMQRDPVAFLKTRVFHRFPASIAAVGFKLFYYHAQDSRRIIWNHLKERRDIHIIHLKRKNSLRTLLSRKKAHMTDKWTNLTGPEPDALSIELSPAECLEQFVWTRAMWREYDDFFRDHPRMDLFYEDLMADHEREGRRVQEFLGVSLRRLRPNTYKQARLPLPEAIVNYAELKNHFKGTEWAVFFEE